MLFATRFTLDHTRDFAIVMPCRIAGLLTLQLRGMAGDEVSPPQTFWPTATPCAYAASSPARSLKPSTPTESD